MSKTKELDAALRQADECYTELGEHIALLRELLTATPTPDERMWANCETGVHSQVEYEENPWIFNPRVARDGFVSPRTHMYAGMKEVPLYYARGLKGQYWELKLDCEAAVRKAFPDERAQQNYARVWFHRFYKEEV